MAAKLKTDENLPQTVAVLLRAAGHDVSTVVEQGLCGVPDSRVASVCTSEGRALLTLDRGLGDIRTYPPALHPGIVILRAGSQEVDRIISLIRRLISLLETHSLSGTLWILDEHRVRIRR